MAKDRSIRLPEPKFLPESRNLKYETGYRITYDRQVYYLALLGLTEVQIGQVMNISTKVITAWKNQHPTFLRALKQGKAEADAKVAHALYQAALGYKHKETVVLTNKIKKFSSDGKVISEHTEPLLVDVEKHYPPNVTAAVKWLQARQPEIWSNRLRLEGKIDINHNIDLSEFSTEELEILTKLSTSRRIGEAQNIEDAEYEEQKDVV
jgi:hypothetical protein